MRKLKRRLALAGWMLGMAGAVQAADFTPCEDAGSKPALKGSLCARESVPGDPSGLSGTPAGDMKLFVRKFPAPGATRGQVWLVAGGPGESGASFYGLVPELRKAFPEFDLIMPDHRGTGFSTRLCPDEEAPGSSDGAALAGAEWASCFRRLNENPAYARQFSETNAAHDLKLLVERNPRKGKTFLYGVSYGTQLVLRTLALGTAGVDGVVLDSLVPLQDDATADLSRRSLVTDRIGREVLAECDARRGCSRALGGERGEVIYRRLLDRATADPAVLAKVPGKNLKRFLGGLLDLPKAADQIPYLIKELDSGKDERLAKIFAEVEQEVSIFGAFPQSPVSIPLVALITASENNLRPGRTAEEVRAEEGGLLFSSGIPALLVEPGLPLYERDGLFARLPERLPPTLVLQGDRDPKTPYDAAMRHVDKLRGKGPVQVRTDRFGSHFVLWSGSACSKAAVREFVLGAASQTRCVEVITRE